MFFFKKKSQCSYFYWARMLWYVRHKNAYTCVVTKLIPSIYLWSSSLPLFSF